MTEGDRDPTACPPRDVIEEIVAGIPHDAALVAHLDACPTCAATRAEIEADNDLLAEFVSANAARLDGARPLSEVPAPPGYEIVGEIHRGAQGVVYRARQLATRRDVALKVILGGVFTTARARARFERESELVAALRHPNIVTVYDGGITTDGTRYFAMELIDGAPIAPIDDPAATVDRFIAIGSAIATAHRRGIIHRDLKPANVLIDGDGTPRVLDFGVAKRVDEANDDQFERTSAGEFIGTLSYAAPEQVHGDAAAIDTRADLYALGVMLYEMLAGRRPYELTGSLQQAITTIRDAAPAPLPESIDGDLRAIVFCALAKDPDRRYPSADAFVADLMRWRRGDAIEVRGDDRLYMLRKTMRRYRVPITIAAAFFVTVATLGGIAWSRHLESSRQLARAQAAITTFIGSIAVVDLENADAEMPASSIRDLLDNTRVIVETELRDFPELRADAQLVLGRAYLSYRLFDDAEALLGAARTSFLAHAEGPDPKTAEAIHTYARVLWQTGRYRDAERAYREALAIREALAAGADDAAVATTMQHLASTLREVGDLDAALERFDASLAMRQRLAAGAPSASVALGHHVRGNGLRDLGRYDDAITAYEAAVTMLRELFGGANWREGRTQMNIAWCYAALEQYDEAAAHLAAAEAIKQDDADPLSLGRASVRLLEARLAHGRGALDLAEAKVDEAVALRRAAYDVPHPDEAEALLLRSRIRLDQGDAETARVEASEAAALLAATLGAEHWRTHAAMVDVARAAYAVGDRAVATETIARAARVLRARLAPTAVARRRAEAVERLVATSSE